MIKELIFMANILLIAGFSWFLIFKTVQYHAVLAHHGEVRLSNDWVYTMSAAVLGLGSNLTSAIFLAAAILKGT